MMQGGWRSLNPGIIWNSCFPTPQTIWSRVLAPISMIGSWPAWIRRRDLWLRYAVQSVTGLYYVYRRHMTFWMVSNNRNPFKQFLLIDIANFLTASTPCALTVTDTAGKKAFSCWENTFRAKCPVWVGSEWQFEHPTRPDINRRTRYTVVGSFGSGSHGSNLDMPYSYRWFENIKLLFVAGGTFQNSTRVTGENKCT